MQPTECAQHKGKQKAKEIKRHTTILLSARGNKVAVLVLGFYSAAPPSKVAKRKREKKWQRCRFPCKPEIKQHRCAKSKVKNKEDMTVVILLLFFATPKPFFSAF